MAEMTGGNKDPHTGKELSPELYHAAREKGTEAPFTGKYWDNHEKGMYVCAVCGAELFSSETKFDSGTGWPSFTRPVASGKSEAKEGKFPGAAKEGNVDLKEDRSHGMVRTEVVCAKCGAHLGHLFDDGPKEQGGKRYCINSVCLDLKKSA